jgi:L-fuconolactonase
MEIVDAQLHLGLSPGADEIIATMDAMGIASVVLDEVWGRNENDHAIPCAEFADGAYRPLSPYAQAAALRYPGRFSFLQRITRRDPQLSALIAVLASSPGCRSLRVVIGSREEREAFGRGAYDGLLGLAQAHALPVSVLSKDAGLLLRSAAPRFPDHCGWVKTDQQWNEVLELARHANTCLKWSHAHRAFGQSDNPQGGIQRGFLRAMDAFGPERVLWASDATHEESGATWGSLLSFVRDNPALSTGDKEWVLGKTARRVFRWNVAVEPISSASLAATPATSPTPSDGGLR